MSSAYCFNFDQSKILSSGNGLKDSKGITFENMMPSAIAQLVVCRTWEEEVAGSNTFILSSANALNLGQSKNLSFD